jgi:hypothetical protein
MKHLVVMEARTGNSVIWAWCSAGDGAGFEDITYTANDGFSPVDIEGDDAPRLERHLFTVTPDASEGLEALVEQLAQVVSQLERRANRWE